MTRAVIYARLSRDRDGSQTATARQVADCRKYADAKGQTVEAVHEDADLSAYTAKVTRPGFEAVLEAVEAGEADVVLSWKLDRLLRRPRDFERLWQPARRPAPISPPSPMASTPRNRWPACSCRASCPPSPSWRARTSASARGASTRRRRGPASAAGRASPLRAHSGDWTVPAEADAIREAVDRLLDGGTMYRVAADWNAAGLRTSTGGEWNSQKVRSMLRSPRLAGLREHRGEIVGKAVWPAIVDPAKHERLRATWTHAEHPNARASTC